jgi:uncharacterized protein (DUF1501 family)
MISLTAIKANAKLIGAAISGLVIIGLFATVLIQHANLKAAETALTSEKDKRLAAEFALTDTVKRQNAQLENIKILEEQRQAIPAAVEPFYLRLDALQTKDETTDAQSTLADRLNGLNADANRLLEQSSR